MTTSHSIPIHSSIQSTTLSATIGTVAIHAKWKQTANQTRKERGIVLPMEALRAPEVPESFRALVESVLLSSAEAQLKDFVDSNPDVWEVSQELFQRTALTQYAIESKSSSSWMSKQELELAFTASATWKRISTKNEFTTNKTYQMAAGIFRDTILKLSGKTTRLSPERCDAILSKIEDSDLETPFGEFLVGRISKMRTSSENEFDISSL